jgi:hypothetical protein
VSISRPVAIAVFCVCVFGSCRGRAFDIALQKDSVDAWRGFVRENPDDAHIEEAKERLRELTFSQVKAAHTVVGYRRFLETYPDTDEAVQARLLLEGLRYNAALDKRTTQSLRQFLIDHPDGKHASDAKAILSEMEVRAAQESSDLKNLEQLAKENESQSDAIDARRDDVSFERALTSRSLFAYLKDFPAGSHRDAARGRLSEIEIEALLSVSDVEGAERVSVGAPPSAKVLIERAKQMSALAKSRDQRVLQLLPDYALRPVEDLFLNLGSSDLRMRWNAAEELGFYVRRSAIEKLMNLIRDARNFKIRERAFTSLQRIVAALPPRAAEFEIERLRRSLDSAADTQLFLQLAVLSDLQNENTSLSAYRKGYEPAQPDPFVLWRVMELRLGKQEWFSAAVAGHQLGLWAKERIELAQNLPSLAQERELCSLQHALEKAVETIAKVKNQKTEFPEDIEKFHQETTKYLNLSSAQLRDVDVKLQAEQQQVLVCGDTSFQTALNQLERDRLQRLALLATKTPEHQLLLELLSADPMPSIRQAAKTKIGK